MHWLEALLASQGRANCGFGGAAASLCKNGGCVGGACLILGGALKPGVTFAEGPVGFPLNWGTIGGCSRWMSRGGRTSPPFIIGMVY